MKIITKAYRCDYCGRVFTTASGAKRHEKACSKNPANQCCCVYCPHLEKSTREIAHDPSYGIRGYTTKVTTFHCAKNNIDLYHPKVLRMIGNSRDAIMEGAQMMPLRSEGCREFDIAMTFIDNFLQ